MGVWFFGFEFRVGVWFWFCVWVARSSLAIGRLVVAVHRGGFVVSLVCEFVD